MLQEIRYKYQMYFTTYKKHSMATHHGGAGHPIDGDLDLHIDDAEGINTGLANDNESTSGSDTIVALGRPKVEGHPDESTPSNQAKLMALMREINYLHQCVEAREGQQAESLDCIEWELQNLSHTSTSICTY